MRILYVFPHPDDESFGPARAIAAQVCAGHEVALLTLTKGGATKMRHRLGLSVQQMGKVRAKEMEHVADVLRLCDLTVLDFPDSGLKELDPRKLEIAILEHLRAVSPSIVVTYPVHGISGFHDHLVTHAVVKSAFLRSREQGVPARRLAFFTLTQEQAERGSELHHLSGSSEEDIDCRFRVTSEDMDVFRAALDCYVTYRETIEQSGIKRTMDDVVAFECFGEHFAPPLDALDAQLPAD